MVPGCPGRLLAVLARLVQEKMGGTSGAVSLPPRESVPRNVFLTDARVVRPAAVQSVPHRRRRSCDRGAERRCRLGQSSACWDTSHEEVQLSQLAFSWFA